MWLRTKTVLKVGLCFTESKISPSCCCHVSMVSTLMPLIINCNYIYTSLLCKRHYCCDQFHAGVNMVRWSRELVRCAEASWAKDCAACFLISSFHALVIVPNHLVKDMRWLLCGFSAWPPSCKHIDLHLPVTVLSCKGECVTVLPLRPLIGESPQQLSWSVCGAVPALWWSHALPKGLKLNYYVLPLLLYSSNRL